MKIKIYQVDAFASRCFEGNPAAICPLPFWLADEQLQAIAEENNLSETAFFVATATGFHLRWFTPQVEVKLCGHATLAAALVLFEPMGYPAHRILFETLSGRLVVERVGRDLALTLPSLPPTRVFDIPQPLIEGLGVEPLELWAADDYLAVLDSEAALRALRPDPQPLRQLSLRGVIVTAAGETVDCVSRFFAPKLGIDEDPVTGSAHATLAPYWGARLGKTELKAQQLSPRGGQLTCHLKGDRVTLLGQAVVFMVGEIELEPLLPP